MKGVSNANADDASSEGWAVSWLDGSARLRTKVGRLLDGLAAKRETRRAIRELSALSDRELLDIGVTRAEIHRAASQVSEPIGDTDESTADDA
jgi:uncharacterized protein YjiS (DUF1127 family)